MVNMQSQNLLSSPLPQASNNGMNTTASPQAGVEQQALNGNKQQTSNFMNALQNIGAGSNNNMMNTPNANGSVPTNLVNPNVANSASNGTITPQMNLAPGTITNGSGTLMAQNSNM